MADAATPETGFRMAAAYWKSKGLNSLADKEDLVGITRKIAGGLPGLPQREKAAS